MVKARIFTPLFIVAFLIQCSDYSVQNAADPTDEIFAKIEESKNPKIADSIRQQYLDSAFFLLQKIKSDSIKPKVFTSLAYNNLLIGNVEEFKKFSENALKISLKIKDTVNLARAQANLGYYYQTKFHHDSAFYYYHQAEKHYSNLKNHVYSGRMLISMATIQEFEKDYPGSENNSINAIRKLEGSSDLNSLYLAHNNLGVVYANMKQFELALSHHNQALDYLDKIENNRLLRAISLNNIGMVYKEDDQYMKAVDVLEGAKEIKGLSIERPQTFAYVLDNLGYSYLKLGNYNSAYNYLTRSLKIRDSLNIPDNIVESYNHIAEYYISKKDTTLAVEFAKKALSIGKTSVFNEGILDSYLLLSIVDSLPYRNQYLHNYIELTSELFEKERNIRNNFARMQFETDVYIEKNQTLTEQKTIILFAGGALILLGGMVFYIGRQRSKAREFQLKYDQQAANNEIFNLITNRQNQFENIKTKERNRISRDLHDGVIGKIFGVRIKLDLFKSKLDTENISKFKELIEELQDTETEIREISKELKQSLTDDGSSFYEVLGQMIDRQSKLGKFEVSTELQESIYWPELSGVTKVNIYRIIQEALNNVIKHANANHVAITIGLSKDDIELLVKDDGVGFNNNLKKSGFGLRNMKERIFEMDGSLEINSIEGTSIKASIPKTIANE